MSTRTEVLDRHSPMLESITPLAAAQLAQYVLRNALLELEVRLSGQERPSVRKEQRRIRTRVVAGPGGVADAG